MGWIARQRMRAAEWLGGSAYEAGRHSRRDPDFVPPIAGPNRLAELGNLGMVWRKVRDLTDNNPLISAAVETREDHIVGCGLDLKPDTGDVDLNRELARLWRMACERVDPSRTMAMWELQRLACRELDGTGEVLLHFLPVAPAFKRWQPMPAVEMIEAERIPLELSGINPDTKNHVRQGVEMDKLGRIVGYHVLTNHPADEWFGNTAMFPAFGSPDLVFLKAENCSHVLHRRRRGQLRGVPRAVSAVSTIRQEDGYQDDSLFAARLQTMWALVVKLPAMALQKLFKDKTKIVEEGLYNPDGTPSTRMASGGVMYATDQSQVEMRGPTVPGQQFEQIERLLQRRAGQGLKTSYAAYSGDSSQTNFSGARVDELRTWKGYRPEQKRISEHLDIEFYWRVVDWSLATGQVRLSSAFIAKWEKDPELLYRTAAKYPGFQYVNPQQESNANKTDIEAGVRSEIDIINYQGGDWEQIVRQKAEYAARVRDEFAAVGMDPPSKEPAAPGAPAAPEPDPDELDEPLPGQDKKKNGGAHAD